LLATALGRAKKAAALGLLGFTVENNSAGLSARTCVRHRRKIAVTGEAPFMGSVLCQRLVSDGSPAICVYSDQQTSAAWQFYRQTGVV
jgi:hypothetical protein